MFNFFRDNYGQLSAILVAAASLGALVARLTPNKADDALFARILRVATLAPTLGLGHVRLPGRGR